MDLLQRTQPVPSGIIHHKVVMRQASPAPVSWTAASTSQSIFMFGVPTNTIVLGVVARLVVSFVAFGMSACSVTIGGTSQLNGSVTSTNFYLPAFSCTQSVSTTSLAFWSPFAMLTTDPQDLTAIFTASGALLNTITAGEIEFTIMYQSF